MINFIKPTFGFLLLLSVGMNGFMLAGLIGKSTQVEDHTNSIVVLTCVRDQVLVKEGTLLIQGFGNKAVLDMLEILCKKKDTDI